MSRTPMPLAPAGVIRELAADLLVVADADGVRVEADQVTVDALERAALEDTALHYRREWPGTIVDDYWTTERLEDAAYADLEDAVAREGLRIDGRVALAWSFPNRDGSRTLVADCTVRRAR